VMPGVFVDDIEQDVQIDELHFRKAISRRVS
jgi:hypothetical protein